MTEIHFLFLFIAVGFAVLAVLMAWLLKKQSSQTAGIMEVLPKTEEVLRRELAQLQQETRQDSSLTRQELAQSLQNSLQLASDTTRESLRVQTENLTGLKESMDRQLVEFREAFSDSTRREIKLLAEAVQTSFGLQNQQFDAFRSLLTELTRSNEQKLEALRSTLETKLASLQQDNNAKLELMRATVEEKLQSTLERRLGESFKLVSENLDKVHVAMGGMQKLAEGVGDLKKIMSNVSTRGAWGEVQLAAILEQYLSPQQYASNVATKGEGERVEFAVRLPGRGPEESCVWLPIDAKFPKEDYERLVAANEAGAIDDAEAAARQLEIRIKGNAKEIRDKYLNPPATTDFAIMFLPTEGLYAEVLRRRSLAETLQSEYRVVVAGPTTLVALLNSLQMGFRTLAIEKRSSEVWETLGAVKTEFGKFGGVLESVKKKLHAASREIDGVGQRTRVMERKLRNVSSASEEEAAALLGPELLTDLPIEEEPADGA